MNFSCVKTSNKNQSLMQMSQAGYPHVRKLVNDKIKVWRMYIISHNLTIRTFVLDYKQYYRALLCVSTNHY